MTFYPFAPNQAPVTGQTFAPTGLTGATAPTRYVGGTASGAPSTGTFAAGDFVIDQTGSVWVCTVAGSPGTWVNTSLATHPEVAPGDAGLLAWNFDPAGFQGASGPTNNTVFLIRVNVRVALSVTNVLAYISAGGTGLTSGQNFAGLYAGQTVGPYTAGQLIGTSADQTASWASGGLKTMALAGGPFAVPAGTFVWVALLSNESAGGTPTFFRASSQSASGEEIGFTVATARWANSATGTTLPGSITPASNSFQGAGLWAGLS